MLWKFYVYTLLNLNRSISQAHPFHLVSLSPWPLYTSICLLSLIISAVLSFHGFSYAENNLLLSLTFFVLAMSFLFRDVISEGTYEGNHTLTVQRGLNLGVALFLDFPEPIIDMPDPTNTTTIILSVILGVIGVAFYFRRRGITITLQLQWVLVLDPDNNRHYYALIDKSDLSGYKLRLLYYRCNSVRGCYIKLNGQMTYALMDITPDPLFGYSYIAKAPHANRVQDLMLLLVGPYPATYVSSIGFPGPNQGYWNFLSASFDIRLYNERIDDLLSNTYSLDRIYPSIDINGQFSININIWAHNFYDGCIFVRWN